MPTFSAELAKTASIIVALALAVFAGFMVHWAVGRTWGLSAHWGGVYKRLPARLRVMDALSFGVFSSGIVVVIGRAWSLDFLGHEGFLTGSTWGFVALLALSGVMNLASSSKIERYWLGPFALVLAVLCFVIARSEWNGG